jgi:ubiquinone/menaquinone biosynthesis C-methylase UbiE
MAVSRRIKDLYKDAYAGGAERDWRDTGAVGKAANIATVWRNAGMPANPTVVEIGCGEGAIANALERLRFFGSYTGFDLSASGIEQARSRDIPGATFAVLDGDRVPVEDDSADLVVMSHVVEHLEHPRVLLYEARRIAKHVVVEVPLELHVRTPRDYVWDDLGHINKYTSTSIRHLVQTCDFEVIGQITTNPDRAAALFKGATRKRRVAWRVKEAGLKAAPPLARAAFTYHETLLARRPG